MHKALFLVFVLTSTCLFESRAQSNCDITYETVVTNADKGSENGSIQINIDDDNKDRYKVFLVNKGADRAQKELSQRTVRGVKPGVFEFIIIDTRRERCYTEVAVTVSEVN